MGIFDFLKRKTKNTSSSTNVDPGQEETVQYKTKINGKNITDQSDLIKKIVMKMVEEDPFKNFYGGKTDEDFTPASKRMYKYAEISTMNVGLLEDKDTGLKILIEGIELGVLPEEIVTEMKPYYRKSTLTAYAFITGGFFKEYLTETQTVNESYIPYDLDIFLQYN